MVCTILDDALSSLNIAQQEKEALAFGLREANVDLANKEASMKEAIARSQRDSDDAAQRLQEVASLKDAIVSFFSRLLCPALQKTLGSRVLLVFLGGCEP